MEGGRAGGKGERMEEERRKKKGEGGSEGDKVFAEVRNGIVLRWER